MTVVLKWTMVGLFQISHLVYRFSVIALLSSEGQTQEISLKKGKIFKTPVIISLQRFAPISDIYIDI